MVLRMVAERVSVMVLVPVFGTTMVICCDTSSSSTRLIVAVTVWSGVVDFLTYLMVSSRDLSVVSRSVG